MLQTKKKDKLMNRIHQDAIMAALADAIAVQEHV